MVPKNILLTRVEAHAEGNEYNDSYEAQWQAG